MTFEQFVERLQNKQIYVSNSTLEYLKMYTWDEFKREGLDELFFEQLGLCKDINVQSLIFESVHHNWKYKINKPGLTNLLFKVENWLCYIDHDRNHSIVLIRFHE